MARMSKITCICYEISARNYFLQRISQIEYNVIIDNTYTERETMGNDERDCINLDGVDLRSFSIKSKSVARELSS